jgi:hypothetical protein
MLPWIRPVGFHFFGFRNSTKMEDQVSEFVSLSDSVAQL